MHTDVFYLCTSGYQLPHMTSRRTGNNETKAYPKIHTYLLIVVTGDCLKRNASQKLCEMPERVINPKPAKVREMTLNIRHGNGVLIVVSRLNSVCGEE